MMAAWEVSVAGTILASQTKYRGRSLIWEHAACGMWHVACGVRRFVCGSWGSIESSKQVEGWGAL